MRFLKLVSHLNIILGGMFMTFFLIDRVNTAMGFIDNDISKWLLLIMSMLTITQAAAGLRIIRKAEREKNVKLSEPEAGTSPDDA